MLIHRPYNPTFADRYPVPLFVALVDILTMVLGGCASYYIRFEAISMNGMYTRATFMFAIFLMFGLFVSGAYQSWRGKSLARHLGSVFSGWLVASFLAFALAFILKASADYSRQWFLSMIIIGLSINVFLRIVFSALLRSIRSRGRNLKGVLLVAEEDSSIFKSSTNEESLFQHGFRVVQYVSFNKDGEWLKTLAETVKLSQAHEVWLYLPFSAGESLRDILYELRHLTVEVRFIPEWGDIPLLNHRVSNIAGFYSFDLSCTPMEGPARVVKRAEDLILGALICLMILPLCLLICIAIKFTSPGPVVFKQYRTGINGRRFKVYKFRSMVVHEEGAGQVTQAKKTDSRVTKVGAFLRRTSLDELPQFFNVLQGRMSIVGPRPHALAHNEYYKDLVESYMQRHKVKPGITGWAQVNGYRGETDTLDKMQKRVECDLWYIDNWSLSLDLKIIFLTLFKGFVDKNAY